MKCVKTKETPRTDFDDVVSSQYESYEDGDNDDDDDDDDDDARELAVMSVNDRLQSQNSAADDDDDDDYDEDDEASWRQSDDNVIVASQSNTQTPPPPPPSSSSLSSSSWVNAATSQSRRKRKPSSTRRYCANLDRAHVSQCSYVDRNANKVICMDVGNNFSGAYQTTDLSQAPLRHDNAGYYTAEQLGCRNTPQNALDCHLRQARPEEHPAVSQSQYQLECDLRPRRCDEDPTVSHHSRQYIEFQKDLVRTRSLEDHDMSNYQLEYAIGPARHDDALAMSQYYAQNEVQYDIRPVRPHHGKAIMPEHELRPANHDEQSTMSQYYKQHRHEYGQVRHMDESSLSQFSENDMRSGLRDDDLRYSSAKTDLQFSSRRCHVSSSDTHRATVLPHTAVPIKTSPDDPYIDHHQNASSLMQSLPLPGCHWSSRYGGKDVESMKDVRGWRGPDELGGAEHGQSVMGHHPTASPMFESCNLETSVIKVEDSFNHDAATPSALPLPPLPASSSSSSLSQSSASSSPFCVDEHLRRDLVAQRNMGDSKRRRRRQNNPVLSTTTAPTCRNNNTRFHTSAPASSTSASTAASASAGAGYLPSRLPFSLPPVPPGYRLVITHRPMTDTSDDPSQVTQLIIDHPSDSTTLIHSNTAAASQPRASTDSITPSRPV